MGWIKRSPRPLPPPSDPSTSDSSEFLERIMVAAAPKLAPAITTPALPPGKRIEVQ
jgi:hypothetical protein